MFRILLQNLVERYARKGEEEEFLVGIGGVGNPPYAGTFYPKVVWRKTNIQYVKVLRLWLSAFTFGGSEQRHEVLGS